MTAPAGEPATECPECPHALAKHDLELTRETTLVKCTECDCEIKAKLNIGGDSPFNKPCAPNIQRTAHE